MTQNAPKTTPQPERIILLQKPTGLALAEIKPLGTATIEVIEKAISNQAVTLKAE